MQCPSCKSDAADYPGGVIDCPQCGPLQLHPDGSAEPIDELPAVPDPDPDPVEELQDPAQEKTQPAGRPVTRKTQSPGFWAWLFEGI